MKFAAIIAALGIALIVTMGPAPASAQPIVIRECGDDYVVTRYNQDGSVKGVWNKQLSDEGTIYTGGQTWTLVEGNPDRFVSDGGAQLQVVACDATPGSSTRGVGIRQVIPSASTLIKNTAQTVSGVNAFDHDYAQAFTTGSHSDGYKLTSVKLFLELKASVTPLTYSVAIHEDSSGAPATAALGTLSGGTSLSSPIRLETFTASGTGISLAASTTYWVVLDVSTSTTNVEVGVTNTDGEDGGGAAGWSIANDRRVRAVGQTSGWAGIGNRPAEFRLAIEGYAKVKSELLSAEMSGTKLVLTFDQNLDATSGTATGAFTVKIDGTSHTPSAISISGRQVTLTAPEVTRDQSVTVSYTKPASNPLKSSDGPEVASFIDQAVSTQIDRLSQPPRAALYVTYDGQQYEAKAYSAERDTLWDYFESECTRLRSVSDPYRDYSLRDADGRLIQARNGWKYVYVQNSQGDITGTRAMTISECTSNKLYQRQQFCEVYADRQGPNEQNICPTYRTW